MIKVINVKIIVASDNHGDMYSIEKILLPHKDADLYLHAGDSQRMDFEMSPFRCVKGNNDWGLDYPNSFIVNTPAGKIYVTHGHKILPYNFYELKNQGVKLIIRGHSHVRKIEEREGVYIVNPGSTSRPRDGSRGTYLVIMINDNKFDFTFKEI